VQPPHGRAADDKDVTVQVVTAKELGQPIENAAADEHGIDRALAAHLEPDGVRQEGLA
jgi:hypothetical protein